jgi:hypothetical protein
VIAKLQRRQGATVAAIIKATGWQPNWVRSFPHITTSERENRLCTTAKLIVEWSRP